MTMVPLLSPWYRTCGLQLGEGEFGPVRTVAVKGGDGDQLICALKTVDKEGVLLKEGMPEQLNDEVLPTASLLVLLLRLLLAPLLLLISHFLHCHVCSGGRCWRLRGTPEQSLSPS